MPPKGNGVSSFEACRQTYVVRNAIQRVVYTRDFFLSEGPGLLPCVGMLLHRIGPVLQAQVGIYCYICKYFT